MLVKWIQQLGQELEMSDLIKQLETNQYEIPFYPAFHVKIQQLEHSCLLKSDIAECSSPELLTIAMESNLFGRGTRGTLIGLSESGKMLTLSLELDYNSSYNEFKEKLEDFISVVDFWKQETVKNS